MTRPVGFVPPPYPYDRLKELTALAEAHEGGLVDLSVGTPTDPPPQMVLDALASSGTERSYPPSIGTPALRSAAAVWIERRFGVAVDSDRQVGVTIGTKEFVAGIPHWLHLRSPDRDTVLYPEISYPTYEMGAILAACRAVPVPLDASNHLDLSRIEPADAGRALCLWVNSPGNPTGALDDLGAAVEWGRSNSVPVFSDECYAEFTWTGEPDTALRYGTEGVVAVHSLSKRSNFAGVRVGFYAGDTNLVGYLQELRKHAGFLVPGPSQAAAVAALVDQDHVHKQREIYLERLRFFVEVLAGIGIEASFPAGAFYLWVPAPEGDAWGLARRLAADAGALVSPGEFYGPAGKAFIRIALVAPMERLRLVADRLAS